MRIFKHRLSNAEPGQEGAGGATQNTPPATNTPAAPAAGAPAAGTVDVQAQINAALAQREAQYDAQFKEATGYDNLKAFTEAQLQQQGKLKELADMHKAEAQEIKGKYQQTLISNALLTAATAAVDPSDVEVHLSGRAQVDDKGNVTIDGKPVADAVKQLLTDKPYLAKAQGGTGSGAPQNAGGGKQITRADFERLNPTDQAAHIKNGGSVV